MGTYHLQLPDGSLVGFDDRIPLDRARALTVQHFPDMFPGTKGFVPAAESGALGGLSSLDTAMGGAARFFGNDEAGDNYDQRAAELQDKADSLHTPVPRSDIGKAYDEKGLGAAAGAAFDWLKDQAGGMAGRFGPALAANAIPGVGTGLALGMLGGEETGENMNRIRQTSGNKNVSNDDFLQSAALGLVQGAIDNFGFGKMFSGVAGDMAMKTAKELAPQVLMGQMSKDAAIDALGSRMKYFLTETGANAALGTGMNVSNEMMRRMAAGQDLTSDDALDAYKEGAIGAAAMSPFFGAWHGLQGRHAAEDQIRQADQRGQAIDMGNTSAALQDIGSPGWGDYDANQSAYYKGQDDAAAQTAREYAAKAKEYWDNYDQTQKAFKQQLSDQIRQTTPQAIEDYQNSLKPQQAGEGLAAAQPDLLGQITPDDQTAPMDQRASDIPPPPDGGSDNVLQTPTLPFDDTTPMDRRSTDVTPQPELTTPQTFEGAVFPQAPVMKRLVGLDMSNPDHLRTIKNELGKYSKTLESGLTEDNAPIRQPMLAQIDSIRNDAQMRLDNINKPTDLSLPPGVALGPQRSAFLKAQPGEDMPVGFGIDGPVDRTQPASQVSPEQQTFLQLPETQGEVPQGGAPIGRAVQTAGGGDGADIEGRGKSGVPDNGPDQPAVGVRDQGTAVPNRLPASDRQSSAVPSGPAGKNAAGAGASNDSLMASLPPDRQAAIERARIAMQAEDAKGRQPLPAKTGPEQTAKFGDDDVQSAIDAYNEKLKNSGENPQDYAPKSDQYDNKYWNDNELHPEVSAELNSDYPDLSAALTTLSKTTENPQYGALAKSLAEYNPNAHPDIKIDHEGTLLPPGKEGAYDLTTHTVTLHPNASERTFLHEIVHAYTSYAFQPEAQIDPVVRAAAQKLRKLYDDFKATGAAAAHNGMKNVKEFIAEAFTNPSFQQELKLMKVEGKTAPVGLEGSYWAKFVNGVRKLLGIKGDTALDHVMTQSRILMNEHGFKKDNEAFDELMKDESMPQAPEPAAPYITPKSMIDGERGGLNRERMNISSPEFRRWFGNSKIVDENGKPEVWLHGTARDVQTFTPKQAGAIFVTRAPHFAEDFSHFSKSWMEKNLFSVLSSEHIQASIDEAIQKYRATGDHMMADLLRLDMEEGKIESLERNREVVKAAQKYFPSDRNIMPVYVKAEKPFDYENPEHMDYLRMSGVGPLERNEISDGSWRALESGDIQRRIKAGGFDSFYMRENGQKNLAVYDPTQVKSIYNRGSFDPNDPRIDYAPSTDWSSLNMAKSDDRRGPLERGAEAGQNAIAKAREFVGDKAKMKDWLREASYNVEQRLFDWRLGVTRHLDRNATYLDADGKRKITAAEALAQAEYRSQVGASSLITGKLAKTDEGAWKAMDDPANMEALHKAVAGVGGIKAASNIMTALTYGEREERAQAMRADAQRVIDEAVQQRKAARKLGGTAAQDALNKIDRSVAQAKQMLEETEFERPPGLTDQIIAQAKHDVANVPEIKALADVIHRMNMNDVDTMEQGDLIGRDLANQFRQNKYYVPLRRAIDTENEASQFSPTSGGTYSQTGKKFSGSGKQVQDLYTQIVDGRMRLADAAIRNSAHLQTLKTLESMGEFDAQRMQNPNAKAPEGWYKVSALEGGQKVSYMVNDLNAYKSLRGLVLDAPAIVNALEKFTSVFRNALVLSPDFMFRNMFRDSLDSWATGGAHQKLAPTLVESFSRFFGSAAKVAKEEFTGAKPHKTDYGVVRYGLTGNREFTSYEREYNKALKDLSSGRGVSDWAAHADNVLSKILHVAESLSSEGEIANRETRYRTKLADTGSETEAIAYARNALDFRRRGDSQAITIFKKLIPFFNSQLQGSYKFYRALVHGDTVGFDAKGAARGLMIKGLWMAGMSTVYNAIMANHPGFAQASQSNADNSWLIPLPGTESFFKLPVPYEFGTVFKTLPENLFKYMSGNQTGQEMVSSLQQAILRTFPELQPVQFFMPQFARPLVEVKTNHDLFFDKPIESEADLKLDPRLRTNNTNVIDQGISAGWNKVMPQDSQASPVQVDHVLRGYFGTLGTAVATVVDRVFGDPNHPALSNNREPLVGSLLTDPAYSRDVDRYYQYRTQMTTVQATANKLKQDGRIPELQAYLKEETNGVPNMTLYGLSQHMNQVDTMMATLRKQQAMIQYAPNLNPIQKRQKIDALRTQQAQIAAKVVPLLRKQFGQ